MSIKKISEILNKNGYPQLCINGEIQDGLAYITYLTEHNCYTDFAKAGYRLFSVPVFFGFNHLNEHSGLDVFNKARSSFSENLRPSAISAASASISPSVMFEK